MVGNVGYIFVGIFSLDRAGPYGLIHGSSAGIAFGGFILSIFSFSVCMVFYQTKIPKIYGIIGLVGPIFTSILHYITMNPLLEWMLLFSILISLIPHFFWISILNSL